jgi:hypothetical protein
VATQVYHEPLITPSLSMPAQTRRNVPRRLERTDMRIPYETMVVHARHAERERTAEADAYSLVQSARTRSGRSLRIQVRRRLARSAVAPADA